MPRLALSVSLALSLAAAGLGCAVGRSRVVPPPTSSDLADGVWVAYNYGCTGCQEIRRGDRIHAIDEVAVESGADVDAIDLADGAWHSIAGVRHGSGEAFRVTIVADPNRDLPPLEGVQPLRVVGAEALDRAPEWARGPLFGHAIPALRFYRADEPRGWVNGRALYGRATLAVIWIYAGSTYTERARARELAPRFYAQLQAQAPALAAAAVDPIFVVDHNTNPETRAQLRALAPAGAGYVPIYNLGSRERDPNNLGLEWSASDLREGLEATGEVTEPVIVIFDARGIVRWHSRGFPRGALATLDDAIAFASTQLPDRRTREDAGGPPPTPQRALAGIEAPRGP